MTPDDAFPWASAQRRELIGHIRSELRILRSRQNRFREFAARLFPHWDIASPLPFELTGHLRNFPERWSVALGIYGRAIDPDVRDEDVPREIPTDPRRVCPSLPARRPRAFGPDC